MTIDVLPLSDALGAEIRGVDLKGRLTVDEIGQIRGALLHHKVILFRRQNLSDDDHLRFARLFGELQVVRTATHLIGEDQHIMHVANRPVDGKPGILPDGEMQFHSDQCYYERPCMATTLYALEVPSKGGNTHFLNMEKAYRALPDEEKSDLERLDVLNVYDYDGNPTVKGADLDPDAPRFVHPLVIVHAETRERLLYANRLMTIHVVGLEREESDRILHRVFDHAEQPRFMYEHVWRPGDLVMWDNLATLHARTDFDPAETRILRRVAIKGPRPAGVGGAR